MQTVKTHAEERNLITKWQITIEPEENPNYSQYLIQSIPHTIKKETVPDGEVAAEGHIAINKHGHWQVVNAELSIFSYYGIRRTNIEATGKYGEATLAYPIDPRMIKSDIEGAQRIEPNADNTGWLFYHETVGERRDHELQLMAVVEGVFRPVFQQYGYDFLRNYSADHATLAKERHSIIASFYGQFIQAIQTKSRSATLSARHTSHHFGDGHLYGDLHTVYEAEKKKWIDANTDEDFGKVSGAFAFIDRRLTIPAPETRWDRDARLEAEALAQEAKAVAKND